MVGCGWAILAIFRYIFVQHGFPRGIWYGIGVGAIVGIIIALVRDDWWIILYSCAAGLAAGVVFELTIVWIDRIDKWRRARR